MGEALQLWLTYECYVSQKQTKRTKAYSTVTRDPRMLVVRQIGPLATPPPIASSETMPIRHVKHNMREQRKFGCLEAIRDENSTKSFAFETLTNAHATNECLQAHQLVSPKTMWS